MKITQKNILVDYDQAIISYTLENENGMSVSLLNYGLTITNLFVPDRKQQSVDIVLGYQNLNDYIDNEFCFGSTIGRFANRIAKGYFSFEGKEYQLEINDGENHLHGGSHGYWAKCWNHIPSEDALVFTLDSPDGDAGYPGDLSCRVEFVLTDKNELVIRYKASSDTKAFANFTNHSYFNLEGHDASSVFDNELQIHASSITEIDNTSIPTGHLLPVENTPFDFSVAKKIGRDIGESHPQLEIAGGYDHNYVLDQSVDKQIVAYSEKTGIEMSVSTTCPGVQLYTSNFVNNSRIEKTGSPCQKQSAFCVETQYFPDAINHDNFDLPIITPDHPFEEKTVFTFGVR